MSRLYFLRKNFLRNYLILGVLALGMLAFYACPEDTQTEYTGCNDPAAQITEFGFLKAHNDQLIQQEYQAVIDQGNCTITLDALYDISKLIAYFVTSKSNDVFVEDAQINEMPQKKKESPKENLTRQESGKTSNNFSDLDDPIKYAVLTPEGIEYVYTVIFNAAIAADTPKVNLGDTVTYSVPLWATKEITWVIEVNNTEITDSNKVVKKEDGTIEVHVQDLELMSGYSDYRLEINASFDGEHVTRTEVITL